MSWLPLAQAAQDAIAGAFGDAAVTYYPGGVTASGYALEGATYHASTEEISITGVLSINMDSPAVGVRRSQLQADPQPADELEVGAPYLSPPRRYRVREKFPDGDGWIVLTLSEVPA